jgi:hypothetical protein
MPTTPKEVPGPTPSLDCNNFKVSTNQYDTCTCRPTIGHNYAKSRILHKVVCITSQAPKAHPIRDEAAIVQVLGAFWANSLRRMLRCGVIARSLPKIKNECDFIFEVLERPSF